MSKTIEEVGLIAGAIALTVFTYGGASSLFVSMLAPAWASAANAAGALFAIGVSAGLAGTFGLLQSILNPNDISVPGAQQNLQNSAAYRRIVYGTMEVGGVKTFDSAPPGDNPFQDDGATNNWRHQVYTIVGHQLTAFGRNGVPMVTIDGILTQLVLDPGGSGYFIPADSLNPYGGQNGFHIGFEFDLGAPGGGSSFVALGIACPNWGATCQQSGCAKVHVAMRYDVQADGSAVGNAGSTYSGNLQTSVPIYVSGRVPTFLFPVVGKPLLDTRLPATIGSNPRWQANTPFGFAEYIIDPYSQVEIQINGGAGQSVTSGSYPGGALPDFPPPTGTLHPLTTQDGGCLWQNAGPIQSGGWPGPNRTISWPYVFRDPNGNLQYTEGGTGPGGNTFVTGAAQPTWATVPGQFTADNPIVNNGLGWLCLGVPSGFAFSGNPSNPALCIYDWLTNTDFGLGVDPASIPIAEINAAANICDEQLVVNIASNGGAVRESRYTCNGVFDESSPRGDVLNNLVASMAGIISSPGDAWHLFAGAYNPPSFALTDADLRADIQFDWRISRRDICNGVKGTFIPSFLPTNTTEAQPAAWRPTDFPPYQANGRNGTPNYLAEDGGQPIWKDLRLGFCTSIWMAQRLAKIALMLLRFQVTGHLGCKLTAFPIQAGDTITFTHARWAALALPPPTTFFVTQAPLVVDTRGGTPALGVDLVLRQTDPSIYGFTAPSSPGNQGEYSAYGSLGVI